MLIRDKVDNWKGADAKVSSLKEARKFGMSNHKTRSKLDTGGVVESKFGSLDITHYCGFTKTHIPDQSDWKSNCEVPLSNYLCTL